MDTPCIQRYIAGSVAGLLSDKLNTEVSIGRIDIGLFNRFIIDDFLLNDRTNHELLKVSRFSIKFELIPLFKGKISINSIQLFGFDVRMNKANPKAKPNYQFIIDKLSSKNNNTKPSKIDLKINSIILRRGRLIYDVFSEKQTPKQFNQSHIHVYNISANIGLKALKKDSINLKIKKMKFDEGSGFSITRLDIKLLGNDHRMDVKDFLLELEHTKIQTKEFHLDYNNWACFKNFKNSVSLSIKTKPSYLTPQDIEMFIPALKNFNSPINLSFNIKGETNRMYVNNLSLNAGKKIKITMNGFIRNITNIPNIYFQTNISNLSMNGEGINFIIKNFIKQKSKSLTALNKINHIKYNGSFSGSSKEFIIAGLFHSNTGTIKTNIKIGHKQKNAFIYQGEIKGNDFNIGQLLNTNTWGKSTFDLKVNALYFSKSKYPDIVLKGNISSIWYKNYNYKNIILNALYQKGGFNGITKINDPNISLLINGNVNMTGKVRTFHLYTAIDKLHLHELHLTDKYPNSDFSVKIKANVIGNSIENGIGEINIDSLSYTSPEKRYFMKNMKITSDIKDKQKVLTLNSEMADAKITGNFYYHTFTNSIKNIISIYIPSLVSSIKDIHNRNDFKFDINIYNTKILPALFNIPLTIQSNSHISGYINEISHRIYIEGYIPSIRYANHEIQAGYFLCENPDNKIQSSVRFNEIHKSNAISYSINAFADHNILNTTLSWANNAKETYTGNFTTSINFAKQDNGSLQTQIDVKPTDVIINDTTWQVHPSKIFINNGIIDINNFLFSHKDKYIHVNGKVSPSLSDSLKVDLNDINLTYLFDILHFDDVNFKGEVSGHTYICNLTKKPQINGQIFVRNFTLNNAPLGDGEILASWDDEQQGIKLNANLSEKNTSHTNVTGYIYPGPKNGLDLEINANKTNLHFLKKFVVVLDDIKGRATGKAHLYGKFKELNIKADVLADADIKINMLNTYFSIRDSLHLTPTAFRLNNTKIYDSEGHQGVANGYLTYKYFRNFDYHLQLNFSKMLVMNTHETDDMPFYGKVYATGNVLLQGGTGKGLDITAALRTDKNTSFVYINKNTASAINNQFITFVDRTPKRETEDDSIEDNDSIKTSGNNDIRGDIKLNLLVDATPDAEVKIIMDPIAGDYITAHGNGSLRGEYYNKGNFNMFGTYNINRGVYKFSLQEVIRKDFTIKEGSNISFNGPPLDAVLNLQASYMVVAVSLTDLIPNISNIVKQTNVKVNCLMSLTGLLPHPTINFNLELPNEQDEIQTLVRNYISTDEQMNTQILYLLTIGKFYPIESNSNTQNSNMMTSVLSSTISGGLNSILSQFINNNNWNFGTTLSTGQNGWSQMDIEGILSGRLLNNRLIINGNFGYRDNPLANTNFIGDFEAEWLLNHSGGIRLKAYNETNDRYYTKTNLTTQGVGIIFQKEFDKWKDLLWWKHWNFLNISKKKKKNTNSSSLISPK